MKYGSKAFEQHVTVCQCMSHEHQFTFTFDPDDKDVKYQECYLDIHLFDPCEDAHAPFAKFFCGRFWRRVWYGVRYVFGYKSRYGAWDSTIVTVEDARKLRGLLDDFVKMCEEKDAGGYNKGPLLPSN
jgi:hypothetical protein